MGLVLNCKIANHQLQILWITPLAISTVFCTPSPIPRAAVFCKRSRKKADALSIRNGLCAGDIEERVKLAQPTVSHHMRILEKAGVVEAKREGHWRWYRRNEKIIAEMMRRLKAQL